MHIHQKVMPTRTLDCHPGKKLDGCLANIPIRILQMFHNGRNDDSDVLPKFSYNYA